MILTEYRRKRDFKKTPEPRGRTTASGRKLSFVIQKHAASHLHYDFRLEWKGALKSWAVPKGPCLDPAVKSLAIEVEDHPLEYGGFEGIIPPGQYGGGTVMLWERGEWVPLSDPEEGFKKGKLDFELRGKKLQGRWKLIRMRSGNGAKPQWLLMKSPDEHARRRTDFDVLTGRAESVKTGREMDQIAGKSKSRWQSNRPGKIRAKKNSPPRVVMGSRSEPRPGHLNGARRESRVEWRPPQLATLVDEAPKGDNWIHEVKYDGYRLIALIQRGSARLLTRNNKDWTARFPDIAKAVADLPVKSAILDGEMVVMDKRGNSDFQALQNHLQGLSDGRLYYFVFDILHCDGFDLTGVPLLERKKILRKIVGKPPASSPIRLSEHIQGKGPSVLRQACRSGLEGILSKKADSTYAFRRSSNWLKIKCTQGQEFVIGGFTDPSGSRKGFGALLLGYHTQGGALQYCGRVGTGFNDQLLTEIFSRLKRLERRDSPFVNPPRGADARGVHWVTPKLVAQIKYGSITNDGILRHPAFQGLRLDKNGAEVVRETPGHPGNNVNNGSSNVKSTTPPRARRTARPSAAPVDVGGIHITHPGRVIFPDGNITKADLAAYYDSIAAEMLPHIIDRPLMLVRCPEGVTGPCFHQKHPSAGPISSLRSIKIREKSSTRPYMLIDDPRGLITLVQFGAVEFHTWGSKSAALEKPDRIIFDLDPGAGVPWSAVVDAAFFLKEQLARLKLVSFAKTSGSKGIHVMVPLRPAASWDDTKATAHAIANAIVRIQPDRFVGKMTKSIRAGKIYIDYLRNSRGSTCVAAYSCRARAMAPVSYPVTWSELKKISDPVEITIETAPKRARRRSDPWPGFFKPRQELTARLLREFGVR